MQLLTTVLTGGTRSSIRAARCRLDCPCRRQAIGRLQQLDHGEVETGCSSRAARPEEVADGASGRYMQRSISKARMESCVNEELNVFTR